MNIKVEIRILPKPDLLDPQGDAVKSALYSLNYPSVLDVRVGKLISLTMQGKDERYVKEQVEEMCRRLLANSLIEDYSYELRLEDGNELT